MKIAIFPVAELEKANAFMQTVDEEGVKIEGDSIVVFYQEILSPADYFISEILRTKKQVEKNLEVSKVNLINFTIELELAETAAEQASKQQLVDTAKSQCAIFEAKLTKYGEILAG